MKKSQPDPHPTEGELAILRVLWSQRGPTTVREVHSALSRTRDTAYTTVLKMMTIMADKGLVERDESERSHRYKAAHPEPVVQSVLLRDLMQRAFAGSAAQLVQSALDGDATSLDELDVIAKMIAEARARRKRS
jgi:BlaI family penicillinase repressor